MLSKLPGELLLSIAGFLNNHTDTLRLASCCRAFYALLLPEVFTSLDLIEHRNGHLSHLVHTLASKPSLAEGVHTLRIACGWRPTSGVRYEQDVSLEVLAAALGSDDKDKIATWTGELINRERNDAWSVLLLALLPNLEDLVLQICEFSNYTLEWLAGNAQNGTSSRILSRLRILTVDCSDVDGGLSSAHFLPIFRLPSLRSFYGHMICDGGSTDEEYTEDQDFDAATYMPDKVGYSNVTHIRLLSSCSRRGFADLIGAPKALESFIFKHAQNPSYADDEEMYASRYYHPLRRHQATLRRLTLTHESTDYYSYYQSHDYDYIGSFAGFIVLKELRLQVTQILDWDGLDTTSKNTPNDILPLSLERLILDGLEREHLTALAMAFEDLLSGGKYRCPSLTYVEVKGNWMHVHQSTEESNTKPRPIPAMFEEFADFKVKLELSCSAVGIEFKLRDLHVEDIIEKNRLYYL
ncbi:hypothetical protein M752DRAFT_39516 [Aspergillus phoenicis ATCC 13157]|uniref:Leucine-rich repeat domain-containing protein n=1 Tax=Aspergillus phoenicis ATCC 13157 TaxID=1353007 RepID=A0A370PD90_ASPPH|nr:hypothetical protein CBS147346_9485 [Aspergillus niger]RDK40151.1 hypothetical protein M752DRAFT_39516 [Aspergillus phoenicis ATCC 13157]GLA31697.1 hypothetical protein AnigIFM63326_010377 [Aspergillus niger]